MDIKIVNEKIFDQMLARVSLLRERCKGITQTKERGLEDWLDSQEVCAILHISPRTLQTYRSSGQIKFSQIGNKLYYHRDSVMALVGTKKMKRL